MGAFKVFLSHRYRSPEVNLYFFDLFSKNTEAELHFEVDGWNSAAMTLEKKDLNVTRLERMIRGAHAFLGIYPFPGDVMTSASPEQLKKESAYFRLELDLAIRSRKPALVYFDDRYRHILPLPATLRKVPFDAQEVLAGTTSPSATGFSQHFSEFCREIEATLVLDRARPSKEASPKVGLLLPTTGDAAVRYSSTHIGVIEELVGASSDVISFSWPPVLDRGFFNRLVDLDWIVIDVGDDPLSSAIAGYIHGRFIPSLRLKRVATSDDRSARSGLERSLYAGVEKGYPSDIVRWQTEDELRTELGERLERLQEPAFRIAGRAKAEEYFRTAAQRKEAVFVSYSGGDAEMGARISAALKKRFLDVFDYKDGKSIRPGEPWLKEIFDKLSRSAVAVPLVSNAYAASDNCAHEAQEIVALRDSKKLRMFPVSLDPQSLTNESKDKLSYFRSTQYLSYPAFRSDPELVAHEIVRLVAAPSGLQSQ